MVASRSDAMAGDSPVALGPDDLKACLALDARTLDGLWGVEQWHKELTDPLRLCRGLTRDHNLVAMACGWLVVDELHITLVAVDPDHRHQGFGFTVLQALLNDARQTGAQRATLEVARCNQAALALYRRCGFTIQGTRRSYYSDGRDALIQWLDLH
ncbi:MAG: GNAT family N-acetyltransferase [Synechococcus sp.]